MFRLLLFIIFVFFGISWAQISDSPTVTGTATSTGTATATFTGIPSPSVSPSRRLSTDLDGDGYSSDPSFGEFQDCCDSVDDGCYDPYLVNPGAWEIPDNGIADRCTDGLGIHNNIPCDIRLNPTSIFGEFIGPTITPAQTERAITAMDICEFKDDDDDPSWGFARQENMVFSLADGTRNGYDVVTGPDVNQASVVTNIGKIFPVNGRFMLAMSTGVAQDINGPSPIPPAPGYNAVSDDVFPPSEWVNGSPTGNGESACPLRNVQVLDSVMATFAMQQPTNMNAWSVKISHLESNRFPNSFVRNTCTRFESHILVLQNTTANVPADHNVAIDVNGFTFRTSNPNIDYFQYCDEYRDISGNIVCPRSDYKLIDTGFDNFFETPWKAVGSSAEAGKPFQIKIATWDRNFGGLDAMVLVDDYIPIAEARTYTTAYGYQYTSDIEIGQVTPELYTVLDANATSVTFSFIVKNSGPEQAGDITLNFTPPRGSSYGSISSSVTTTLTNFPASAPYEDNSFKKIHFDIVLQTGESFESSITFNILPNSPPDLQFKLSVTCSSIEKIFNNNYHISKVYINKEGLQF